jgi:hypothetical protein
MLYIGTGGKRNRANPTMVTWWSDLLAAQDWEPVRIEEFLVKKGVIRLCPLHFLATDFVKTKAGFLRV